MLKSNFLMLLTLVATPAFADCDHGCDQPPVSANATVNPFSIDTAEAMYKRGVMPSEQNLYGSWKAVAIANEPDSIVTGSSPDEYDAEGIKGADGLYTYDFAFERVTGPDADFAGHPLPASSTFSVTIATRSGGHQGPNTVDLRSQPKSACFAQYAYNQYHNETKSHFNYACRLVSANLEKMVCSVTFIEDESEYDDDSPEVNEANGVVQAYFAYVKQAD